MKGTLLALGATVALLAAARPFEPFAWGHSLSLACQWLPQPSEQMFGRDYPEPSARAAERACWARHGAKSFGLPLVKEVVARFPTRAEVAAQNGDER